MQYFFRIGLAVFMLAAMASCGDDEDKGTSLSSYILAPPIVPDSDLICQLSADYAEMSKVDFRASPLRKNLAYVRDSGKYNVSLNFYIVVFAAYVRYGQGLCALHPSICAYSANDSLLQVIHEAGSLSANSSLALQDKSNEKTERKLVELSATVDVPSGGAYISIAVGSNIILAHGGTNSYPGLGYACAYIQQNADKEIIKSDRLP
jgi:hypothetical protein